MLYAEGEAVYPWMGLWLYERNDGLEVIYVMPGSPADKAGIQESDVIHQLNGQEFKTVKSIQNAILEFSFPTLVRISWKRQDERRNAVICLSKRPYRPFAEAVEVDARDNLIYPLFGIKLDKVSQSLFRTTYLVKKVLPGSIADETGVSVNDSLTVLDWRLDEENELIMFQIQIKRRQSGSLETNIQWIASLRTTRFL